MMLNHAQNAPFRTVLISSLCPVHRHSVSNQFHFPMIVVGVYTWNCLDTSRGAKRMVRGNQLEAANFGCFDATFFFWFDLPDLYMLHLLTYSRKTLCHLWSNVLSKLICYQILGCCRSLVNGKVSDSQPMISLYYWAAYIEVFSIFPRRSNISAESWTINVDPLNPKRKQYFLPMGASSPSSVKSHRKFTSCPLLSSHQIKYRLKIPYITKHLANAYSNHFFYTTAQLYYALFKKTGLRPPPPPPPPPPARARNALPPG